jgi:hypothetical protein
MNLQEQDTTDRKSPQVFFLESQEEQGKAKTKMIFQVNFYLESIYEFLLASSLLTEVIRDY